jgi:hypothetical protein
MFESVITFLVYLVLLAILVYLVIWVVRDVIGVPIPERVIQLLWVIVALVVILWFFRMILPHLGAIPGFK